ncbi:hypothetical protein D3C78_1189060 [compost metagenome]
MATPTLGVSVVVPEFSVFGALVALSVALSVVLLLPPQPVRAAPSKALANRTEVIFFIIH